MISSDASEHSAMPAMEAATTPSRTDSAKPAGAQVISRFAQVEALCQVEKSEVSLIIFRTMPGVISRMHLQSGQGFLVKQGEQGSSNRAIE